MNRDEALTETAMNVSPGQWNGEPIMHYRQYEFGWNEYMFRRTELINEPNDADAPEGMFWRCQKPDGQWLWYDKRPCQLDSVGGWFGNKSKKAGKGKIPAGHRWQDTLKEVNVKRELNPTTSSLTDSQAREAALETRICSDGALCGQGGCCDDCPNAPHAQDARLLDEKLKESIQFGKIAQNAGDILNAAAQHMQDRASTYDKPQGERSMAATVEAFRATTGITLTEEQGWHFMALLKLVRSQQGNLRLDSYEDGAAYFALAGEAAAKHR